ncbi:hypothetical protein RN001_004632 [Aquatica leii]|uniref:Uncharacterized protein n=1 Tax=Aquatica leii TaxID=1421715 RepID=A0AAN7QJQ1_9COLE|nr:hypothetical protein RN001_004632 [Aquatica leii]
MLRNKHLKSQAQLLVVNVLNYFTRERDNKGAFVPFESVMQRTAEACGVSINTVSAIKKRVEQAEKENKAPEQPARKRKRIKTKSCDVEDFVKDAVKRKVYEMHSNPNIKKLVTESI